MGCKRFFLTPLKLFGLCSLTVNLLFVNLPGFENLEGLK